MQQTIEKASTKAETILVKLVECGKLLPGSLDRVSVLVLGIHFSSLHKDHCVPCKSGKKISGWAEITGQTCGVPEAPPGQSRQGELTC